MTLDEDTTAEPLLLGDPDQPPNRTLTSTAVRRRLALCLFLYTTGLGESELVHSESSASQKLFLERAHVQPQERTPLGTSKRPLTGISSSRSFSSDQRTMLVMCHRDLREMTRVIMIYQVYPKVILEYFDENDRKASVFTGWLTFSCSAVEFIAVPSLSSASDILGRRVVIAASLALSGVAMVGLGIRPDSIVAVVVCQIVTSICSAVLPVSQAVVVDTSLRDEGSESGEISHGLGLIAASFGIALSVGPILGGLGSKYNRSFACWICAGMSMLALLFLRFYGWSETAPLKRGNGAANGPGIRWSGRCSSLQIVNPLSNLKILFENSLLMQLSACLCLYSLAVDIYTVFYNYFDYRYHWGPLEIAVFYSVVGFVLAITTGVGIRFIVPNRLSESRGVVVGLLMLAASSVLDGLAPRGWVLYVITLGTAVRNITEPCIQAIMAKLVDEDCQGKLQGATSTLRIVAQGIAAVVYSQAFSFGLSNTVKDTLGFAVPGLPFFLAGLCSLSALMIALCALRKLDSALVARATSAGSEAGGVEEGMIVVSPHTWNDDAPGIMATTHGEEFLPEMSEPLLDEAASSVRND